MSGAKISSNDRDHSKGEGGVVVTGAAQVIRRRSLEEKQKKRD